MKRKAIVISISLLIAIISIFILLTYTQYGSFKNYIKQDQAVLSGIVKYYVETNGELPKNENALTSFIEDESNIEEMFEFEFQSEMHKMHLGYFNDIKTDQVFTYRYKSKIHSFYECKSINEYNYIDYLFSKPIIVTVEQTPCLCDLLPINNKTILKKKKIIYDSEQIKNTIDSVKLNFFAQNKIVNPYLTAGFDSITSFYYHVKLNENGFKYIKMCSYKDDFSVDLYSNRPDFYIRLSDSLSIYINPILEKNEIDEAFIPITFFSNIIQI